MPTQFSFRHSPSISMKMSVNIWKWRIAPGFACSRHHHENHFHLIGGNGGCCDFHISTVATPYGGPACAENLRPARRESGGADGSLTALG
jgi:hypothetical protein